MAKKREDHVKYMGQSWIGYNYIDHPFVTSNIMHANGKSGGSYDTSIHDIVAEVHSTKPNFSGKLVQIYAKELGKAGEAPGVAVQHFLKFRTIFGNILTVIGSSLRVEGKQQDGNAIDNWTSLNLHKFIVGYRNSILEQVEMQSLHDGIESCEEVNSYESHIDWSEAEIQNKGKNVRVQSAAVADKRFSRLTKAATHEPGRQILRGIVWKRSTGTTAMAGTKLPILMSKPKYQGQLVQSLRKKSICSKSLKQVAVTELLHQNDSSHTRNDVKGFFFTSLVEYLQLEDAYNFLIVNKKLETRSVKHGSWREKAERMQSKVSLTVNSKNSQLLIKQNLEFDDFDESLTTIWMEKYMWPLVEKITGVNAEISVDEADDRLQEAIQRKVGNKDIYATDTFLAEIDIYELVASICYKGVKTRFALCEECDEWILNSVMELKSYGAEQKRGEIIGVADEEIVLPWDYFNKKHKKSIAVFDPGGHKVGNVSLMVLWCSKLQLMFFDEYLMKISDLEDKVNFKREELLRTKAAEC